jgi:Mycoplasma protein of unknown function, DUF285
VTNATDLRSMFYECRRFNSDVSGWHVANGIVDGMFHHCWSFDREFVSGWPEYAKRKAFLQ